VHNGVAGFAAAFAVAVLTAVVPANAADVSLMEPIRGFAIRPMEKQKPLYGDTSGAANWRIAQWNNPSAPLGQFEPYACPTTCFAAQSPSAKVLLQISGDTSTFSLEQHGADLPCTQNGRPREFDLLASPMHFRPQPVADFANLTLTLRLTIETAKRSAAPACNDNQGQAMAAAVLRNDYTEPKQVFFYHLILFRYNVTSSATGWWARGRVRGGGRSQRFGFRDSLSSFDKPAMPGGNTYDLQLDLLPRLKSLIESGMYGMDKDPTHWQMRSAYFGQHIWGKTDLSSRWERVELVATQKP
jgi:hypothetical protein